MSAFWRGAVHAALLVSAAGVVAGAATAAAGEQAAPRFQPPQDRPMVLSRTLWRDLADGKAIVATRRYRVRFARTQSGWRVDGELIASEIECPAALARLAEIERARPDVGLFPIELDAAGVIVPRDPAAGAAGAAARASLDKAVAIVLERLAAQPPAPETAEQIRGFLLRLQGLATASVMAEWPAALFLPDGADTREEARFALPDGSEGSLTAEIESDPASDAATMGRITRRIVTEIAGDRRTSREQWTLAAPEV